MIMIMNFLYFICVVSAYFLIIEKRKKSNITFRRKGIINKTFTLSIESSNPTLNNRLRIEDIQAQIEVSEIKNSDSKSKIQVLEISLKYVTNLNDEIKSQIKNLINNTWILSDEIEWNKSSNRNDKIDNILN